MNKSGCRWLRPLAAFAVLVAGLVPFVLRTQSAAAAVVSTPTVACNVSFGVIPQGTYVAGLYGSDADSMEATYSCTWNPAAGAHMFLTIPVTWCLGPAVPGANCNGSYGAFAIRASSTGPHATNGAYTAATGAPTYSGWAFGTNTSSTPGSLQGRAFLFRRGPDGTRVPSVTCLAGVTPEGAILDADGSLSGTTAELRACTGSTGQNGGISYNMVDYRVASASYGTLAIPPAPYAPGSTSGCAGLHWSGPSASTTVVSTASSQTDVLITLTWTTKPTKLEYRFGPWDVADTFTKGGWKTVPLLGGSPFEFVPLIPAAGQTDFSAFEWRCTDSAGTATGIWGGGALFPGRDPSDWHACAAMRYSGPTAGQDLPTSGATVTLTWGTDGATGSLLVPSALDWGLTSTGTWNAVTLGPTSATFQVSGASTMPTIYSRCTDTTGQTIGILTSAGGSGGLTPGERNCVAEAGVGWSPTSWVTGIIQGFGCLLIPRTASLGVSFDRVYAEYSQSPLYVPQEILEIINGADDSFSSGYAATKVTDCKGPVVNLPLAGGTTELAPFSTCDEVRSNIADLVRVGVSGMLVLSTAYAVLRMFMSLAGVGGAPAGDFFNRPEGDDE